MRFEKKRQMKFTLRGLFALSAINLKKKKKKNDSKNRRYDLVLL
jgi:hypothetical protein